MNSDALRGLLEGIREERSFNGLEPWMSVRFDYTLEGAA